MLRFLFSIMSLLPFYQHSLGQDRLATLPLIAQPSTSVPDKPMIFYISGDGGWNKFSKGLTLALVQNGYPVISLDASSYFWDKKTQAQSSEDVTAIINAYAKKWNRKKVIMVGYSFGADVMPFIYNASVKNFEIPVEGICLLSPSTHTDFEVHVMELFGSNSNKGESVITAINSSNAQNLLMIFGDDEKDFPLKEITIKNYKSVIIPGGHHYDHATDEVANIIIQNLNGPGVGK